MMSCNRSNAVMRVTRSRSQTVLELESSKQCDAEANKVLKDLNGRLIYLTSDACPSSYGLVQAHVAVSDVQEPTKFPAISSLRREMDSREHTPDGNLTTPKDPPATPTKSVSSAVSHEGRKGPVVRSLIPVFNQFAPTAFRASQLGAVYRTPRPTISKIRKPKSTGKRSSATKMRSQNSLTVNSSKILHRTD